MNFKNLAEKRFSCRKFTSEPVSRELLLSLADTARLAPSAKNLQPFKILLCDEVEIRKQVCATYRGRWIDAAPVVAVICVDHREAWCRPDGKRHGDIDAAIIADHFTLAATEAGLGTCWVCLFDAFRLSIILKLPEQVEPVILIPIGYPAEEASARHSQRKETGEIFHWNSYPDN
ncbi:MAG: nitroreductase family protein [Candidatus Cloacimonetes bacterium]|nr:nitroreductase family protein [Candidatus Cloacimonadota bacterium]